MVENISGLGPIKPIKPEQTLGSSPSSKGSSKFKEVLGEFVEKMKDMQLNADESIKKLATGEIKDIHQVMGALAEADVSFKMMMTVRAKLLEAYKEIMKMQV